MSGASYQDQIQHHISSLDKELSKYPALNNLEKQTTIPKVYAILGLAAVYLFLIIFNLGSAFLVNVAGFIIPTYYSLEALFSSGKADDTQWLTYWVVYAFLTVFESAVNATYWFPFYWTFKFVLVLWLALPQTGGAQIVFRSLVQPLFARFFTGNSFPLMQLRSDTNLVPTLEKPHGQ
ncbi:MAG: ER membrane protein DP1/Yop1 [Bogoriella megaspora]|nr:MAG: ER membrane protein DP1/Yop1 [Bogoriella megaspora]